MADPHHPGIYLAAAPFQGLLRSTDLGDSWSVIAFPQGFVLSVGVSPHVDGTLFAMLGSLSQKEPDTALRSTDGGITWLTLPLAEDPSGFDPDQPHCVFDPSRLESVFVFVDRFNQDNAGPVYRSLDGGLTSSRDQGDTWGPLTQRAPRDIMTRVAASPAAPSLERAVRHFEETPLQKRQRGA